MSRCQVQPPSTAILRPSLPAPHSADPQPRGQTGCKVRAFPKFGALSAHGKKRKRTQEAGRAGAEAHGHRGGSQSGKAPGGSRGAIMECWQTPDDARTRRLYQRTAPQASEDGALEQTHKHSHPTIKNTSPSTLTSCKHSHSQNTLGESPGTGAHPITQEAPTKHLPPARHSPRHRGYLSSQPKGPAP